MTVTNIARKSAIFVALTVCAYWALGVETAKAQNWCPGFSMTECGQFATHSIPPNTSYLLENNAWSDPGQCIQWTGVAVPAFCVSTTVPGTGFPNLLQGQVFNNGPTTGWTPVQVSAIKNWKLDWQYNFANNTPSGWNALVEFWATTYNPTGKTVFQPDGTELLIWLNPPGSVPGPGTITGHALIEGIYWNVYAGWWPANQNTTARWNYIAYVPATTNNNLRYLIGDVAPFFADAQTQTGAGTQDPLGPCQNPTRGNSQCMDSSWWITSVQGGFELFGGGNGLLVDQFASSPKQVGGAVCAQPGCRVSTLGMF